MSEVQILKQLSKDTMVGTTSPDAGTKRASSEATEAEPMLKKRKRYEEKPERSNRRDEKREMMAVARKTWEQLRPKATSKEKSRQLVGDLSGLLKGRIVEFVFRHDGSRIVQWMLSDGTETQKKVVLDELMEGWTKPTMETEMPFFVKLACDRYGHHLAFKVLRVADKKHRSEIYERYLKGNCAQLIRSSHGADVLDFAYQTVLRAKARSELVLELLYTREKKLFQTVRAKLLSERDRTAGNTLKQRDSLFVRSLELVGDTFMGVVVDSAGAALSHLIDKENLLRFEIVHAALKEYLQAVMESYPKEKSQELAVSLAPFLVHLAHTKPGVHVAVTCVKLLDAKHRKKVVRALKTHIRKLLEDEYGHRLILALFEWVDDTRLVGKTVSVEIFSDSSMAAEMAELPEGPKTSSRGGKKKAAKKGKEIKEKAKRVVEGIDMEYMMKMCQHKYARMPLLSLLCGRNTRYFNPDIYTMVWSDVDSEKFGQLSKKDATVRRQELRMVFDKAIIEVMRNEMVKLLKNHWSAPMVVGALVTSETCESVKSGLVEVLNKENGVTELIEDTCGRKSLGTIFKVGGGGIANEVIEKCGMGLIRRLGLSDGCMTIAENIVKAADRKDGADALEAARNTAQGDL